MIEIGTYLEAAIIIAAIAVVIAIAVVTMFVAWRLS